MPDPKRQQKPVESLQELQRNWDTMGRTDAFFYILAVPGKEHNRWDADEFFASGRHNIDRLFERLAQLGVSVPEGKALDFGCGVGRLTQALASRFSEAHGVDIAPSMLEQAEQLNRYPGRCFYHLNLSNDLARFAEGTFSFLYTLITLQHIAPQYIEGYLLEFGRVLAPGGVVVFQLPVRLRGKTLPSRCAAIAWRLVGPFCRLLPRRKPAVPREAAARDSFANYAGQFSAKMNGFPPRKVRRLLALQGVDLVAAVPDLSAGCDWISKLYVGVKRR